jgi:serine/threonine protein kinase
MELRDQLQHTLGNAYQLERELGGGGMSRVFVSHEHALGRKVVVKVLPPSLSGGVNIERFKREIMVAARLQHAHIVPVLSAGETEGLPYYMMPYVDGESLRARLARGPLSISECVNVLRDVARALAYAHEQGVVHRDIKPDNIMLAGESAVVTDFGIAKAIAAARDADAPTSTGGGALTQLGTSLGPPAYLRSSRRPRSSCSRRTWRACRMLSHRGGPTRRPRSPISSCAAWRRTPRLGPRRRGRFCARSMR